MRLRRQAKRILDGLTGSPLATPAMKAFSRASSAILLRRNWIVCGYDEPVKLPGVRLIRRIADERGMTLSFEEAYTIWMTTRKTAHLEGDIAELGVYRGASARLIGETKGARQFHLFDTFEGLPDPSEKDAGFRPGQYACSLESVQQYLTGIEGLHFHRGFFPSTAGPAAECRFSFVHLDVDLYQSTRDGLEFFYPRMAPGGVIISHDYLWSVGVKRAFDEFFAGKPEPVLEPSGSQALIVKCG